MRSGDRGRVDVGGGAAARKGRGCCGSGHRRLQRAARGGCWGGDDFSMGLGMHRTRGLQCGHDMCINLGSTAA